LHGFLLDVNIGHSRQYAKLGCFRAKQPEIEIVFVRGICATVDGWVQVRNMPLDPGYVASACGPAAAHHGRVAGVSGVVE
jgi:hypothetical protein